MSTVDELPPPPPPTSPAVEKARCKAVSTASMSYIDYCKTPVNLKGLKLPDLKSIAKGNRLHISGSKTMLIERIQSHFRRTGAVLQIQRRARGFLVRRCFTLRGPAYKDRSRCVNESDFYTLEPLSEIPPQEFFSCTDDKQFTYGFNIQSLMTLYRKRVKINNPYNRESFSQETTVRMFQLYKMMQWYFPNHLLPDEVPVPVLRTCPPPPLPSARRLPVLNSVVPAPVPNTLVPVHMQRIREMRGKPIHVRIQELFMEMDQLGNYTDAQWFSQLNRDDLVAFYTHLMNNWRYRAQLPYHIKTVICPLGNPFDVHPTRFNQLDHRRPDAEIQLACVSAMENMVCTAVDVEYRKLGALHVLTALTAVSLPARNHMIWLYDSLYEL